MENTAAGRKDNSHLFNVVYDPRFDRFFLEDDDVYCSRNRSLERQKVSIPWEKWIIPPKSPPKRVRQDNVNSTAKDPASDSGSTAKDTKPQPVASVEVKNNLLTDNTSADEDTQISSLEVPTLDLSSGKPLAEDSAQIVERIPTDPVSAKPKKIREQDYTIHFERSNQDVANIMVSSVVNTKPNNENHVKWNGQVLHVKFPGLRLESENQSTTTKAEAQQREHLHGSAHDQWLASTYKFKNLMRIRAHADGLRRVNSANRFVAVSSSESSDSEEEMKTAIHEAEDENDLMPVFFRDDRVLFRAKGRLFKGTVRRRIPKSDFYNIRADNGSLFDAVIASKMELLDEPEEQPYYQYSKGDKILWVPDAYSNNSDEEELTYKAKIVHVHPLNRFDLLLRTGRVAKKVPYEQLRPRDESDFVSTATSRHR
ncbi:hypothetical protein PPTG_16783 [Phytophthora nicotianae INRA-310]|uniref:Uncharacterized protein n=5 Tax=Phytophthora nicotianae TaxID=4792 RepID=W2PPF7_PHYN3|nr:hypothetical protein PPTG_16783 [Phytophthora nicotianae INRA-310]ETI36744.1 hypothetical protein F443_17175 [Phytophthora nicotianae P1569]ETM36845.1 hypothetical protein L914_16550 [Phytophthora nicotianae]ETO65483.1 hypothetical protein F444_17217 [Phytophthora nicotianae P1976]KUF84278.1 hypothetical protein AM587_10012502 [Phytophthora nicotianae]ETN02149.1 hypothetical protein PPTG_16783 [Phytophthora nicotianae INRA-310]